MVRKERRRALREALADLQRYAVTVPRDRFLADRDVQRQVLHALYVAVQACLDEAVEACQASGIEAGDTYREAFLALGRAGLLDPALASRLADWASFRNVLAHFYPVLDLERAHGALGEIDDLRAFESWLQGRSPD
ncbi:MAG: DUF86 domain-containing protein [Planctomycetes bacterium]|nr:DUF86 domain-containing protein [Planctomycetota bacterium]